MTFLQNYPVIAPFASLLAAEAVKFFIDLARNRSNPRFVNPGGMPSGHSSFVSSMVVMVAYREGVESTLFMIAAVVALIVMYDAIYLRNEAGKHASVINEHHSTRLQESLGHTHFEVLVGAAFGAGFTFLLLFLL